MLRHRRLFPPPLYTPIHPPPIYHYTPLYTPPLPNVQPVSMLTVHDSVHHNLSENAVFTGDQAQADTQPQPQGRLREHPDGTREIGNLSISPTVLGYGSSTHGTVVFAGDFGGRPVAVKRLLVQFHDVALKEVDAFIASDEHPNVLRCVAVTIS